MTNANANQTRTKTLDSIILNDLKIASTEVRNRDALDFHELHILILKDALAAAYEAGQRNAAK